jgi:hypothetical protein
MTNETRNKVSNMELDLNKNAEKIKRLETSLKENEDKFIEDQSNANFGFWEIDPVTLKSTWSEGVFKIADIENKKGSSPILF